MHSEATEDRDLRSGRVVRKNRGTYLVREKGHEIPCSISSVLRKELIYPIADPSSRRHRVLDVQEIDMVDPLAVGDDVRFVDAGDGSGHITEVLPRRNYLARRTAGVAVRSADAGANLRQILVANVDQVVAVMPAAQPGPNWALLDRYLVTAEANEIPALICITKMDLLRGSRARKLEAMLESYRAIGYPVVTSSAVSGAGLEEVKAAFADRLSVLVGKSGVGKSSLLNALEPGLGLRVNEVRARDGRGRHTTTHLEMFPLAGGGGVVDTPGMREFAFWGLYAEEVAYLFPEMRPYLGACKFGASCVHDSEPECAVKGALEAGAIPEGRYESYLKLVGELG